jgi:hypothetical protein
MTKSIKLSASQKRIIKVLRNDGYILRIPWHDTYTYKYYNCGVGIPIGKRMMKSLFISDLIGLQSNNTLGIAYVLSELGKTISLD